MLKANSYKLPERTTTADYVLLQEAMGLAKYCVHLPRFPQYPVIEPFATWSPLSATKSLSWYDAYNKVKHDRESAFHSARLDLAITAVAAVYVMLAAQFGPRTLQRYGQQKTFAIKEVPEWHPAARYYGPLPRHEWIPMPYPFPPKPVKNATKASSPTT